MNTSGFLQLPQYKMLWMLLCQAAVIAPHAARLPVWITLFCVLIGIWRYLATRNAWGLPPRSILLVVVIGTTLGVLNSYNTLLGRDPGVALLIIMLSLKLLEMRHKRDVMLFIFLGYFLVVTNFLFTQSIAIAVYMFFITIWLTSTLIIVGHPTESLEIRARLKTSASLVTQAIPVMLILFLLFPRIPGPIWKLPEDARKGITGLSDTMSPGNLSELSRSDAVAFRVSFEGKPPGPSAMYWRGPVLWEYDGRTWKNQLLQVTSRASKPVSSSDPVGYTVTLEPHNQRVLLALDLPAASTSESHLNSDFTLLSDKNVTERIQYRLQSFTRYHIGDTLSYRDRHRALALPPGINPRAYDFARRIQQQYPNTQARIRAVLQNFNQQPFVYTLNPPLLGQNAVDEFLFSTRRGFCEHYSSSFVFLMRAMGIPARVVIGYQGGEYNQSGNYYIVRQSDAHAWAEVWTREQGWQRFDPTAAVAPERVERGIDAALPDRPFAQGLVRSNLSIVRNLVLYWDSINYQWTRWVLGYDTRRQFELLRKLGMDGSWEQMAVYMLAFSAFSILLVSLWLGFRGKRIRKDAAYRLFEKFCNKLSKQGYRRAPYEGPVDFSNRVSRVRPDLADSIQRITRSYTRYRYGNATDRDQLVELRRLVQQFRPQR